MDERRKKMMQLGLAVGLLALAGVVIAVNSGIFSGSAEDPNVVAAERRAAELQEQSRAAGFDDAPPPAARPKPEGSGRKPLTPGP
jgi:hypothetical protein